ncbi:MAG: insulinase family protein [Bacteroidales bacterium]|nr:insulinase family protein [Bacteroidales bacterium]
MNYLDRKIQPEVNLIKKIDFFQPEKITLDNGIQAYLINTGTQDVTKIEFLFNAGSWHQEKLLVAKFTNKLMKEGTENYSSKQIAEKIDYYGAHLETSANKDMAGISLYSLNKHLESTLPIFKEIITYPVFPENELDIYIQNRKQEFTINNEKVKYVARRKFNELIFGKNHPYGRLFTHDDFNKIKKNDLVNFHKNYYSLSNCKIIVAGKLRAGMADLLNNHFGRINNGIHKLNNKTNSAIKSNNNRIVHLKKHNAIQSAIRIGKTLFNKKHPDYLGLKVLNTVLGGYFGSRLMTNIREEKGYTYGIGSAIVSLQNSGYFFISSEVGADVTQNAIDEIYHEIQVLKEEKVPVKEIDLVRNYMLGSILRSNDGAFAISESFKDLIEYELDYDYYKNFIEIIKSISTEELRSLAQKYFKVESLFEMKVGR